MDNDLFSKKIDEFALKFTNWIGSPASLIAHTSFFVLCFLLIIFGFEFEKMLLFLTTIVSLEAIYLAILIQLSINRTTKNIENVEQNLEEIQENIDEIQDDVDEIQEDVGEIQEDVGEIQGDINEIQGDVDEIQEDVDDMEKEEESDTRRDIATQEMIGKIQIALEAISKEIEDLKQKTEERVASKKAEKLLNPKVKNNLL